jgi:hypothetical protein
VIPASTAAAAGSTGASSGDERELSVDALEGLPDEQNLLFHVDIRPAQA